MSEEYNFVNVKNEPNRTSDVWNYFLLDKKREVAKCEACFEKHKITKILVATKGCTKSMSNHIKTFHKPKPENPSKNWPILDQYRNNFFVKRKCLGESIVKLALERISFRSIASQAMRDLVEGTIFDDDEETKKPKTWPSSANTVRRHILKHYNKKKQEITSRIAKKREADKRYSITMDEYQSIGCKKFLNANVHHGDGAIDNLGKVF